MGGRALCYVTTLISPLTISIAMAEMFLICYVISREHMFKGLRKFMGESPSR